MRDFSDKEKKILAAAALCADTSSIQIAKRSGFSVGTVRQVLKSLSDRGLIEPRNYIDIFQLNLCSYVLLFSLASKKASSRKGLVEFLSRMPGVVWFAEVGGDYEFIVNICQGNVYRLTQQLDLIGARFGNIFANKSLAQHLSYKDYSYGFLSPKHFPPDYVGTEEQTSTPLLDEIDHRVLKAIAAFPLSHREVARSLGLPSSTVQYRFDKLRRLGVWKRTIYLINHSALGYNFALFLLYASTSTAAFRNELHEFCLRHPNVITLTESIGAWDFEVSALATTANDLRQLRDEFLEKFSDRFYAVSTIPCYRLIKWNQYPFDSFDQYLDSVRSRSTPQKLASIHTPQELDIPAGKLKWAANFD